MSSNIVVEWLRSLHLGQYAESFIDNGYDDLEICKQVGDPDLDAIGVFNPSHRNRLLQSVRTLREEGAASVYFTLEETTAVHEDCQCDNSSARSSRTSSGHQGSSDKEQQQQQQSQRCATGNSPASSSADSAQELGKYLDEYEEGKAELVKIPKIQLKLLLKEKLSQDGIRLSCQPYSTSTGERGYVEGLASRYADLFNTHYGDVLEHLEDLRRREWEDLSPRIRVLETPAATSTDAAAATGGSTTPGTPQGHHGITTSHSQPIYVPGKYSPSSCLSDKEEDEIYGFGYGVYGKQMLHRQQQHKMIISPQQQLAYQSCLSPRSAYFYEFPPSEQAGGQQTNKKKTSFSRFLRGLKTGHRKEKHSGSSPRHSRAARVPQQQQQQTAIAAGARVGTPDSVVESMLPSIVDPRDYDRLRFIQMNGGTGNSFEETIHRLKVQEVLKKRERFHKEHEEILRDIRQGLMQYGREGIRPTMADDNTYMYDDDPRVAGLGPHWYDEPPYESDPEDFLMGTSGQPMTSATVQNGRVCFTLNLRSEPRGEGVISLRTAGDISIPRDPSTNGAAGVWLNNAHGIAPLSGASLTPRGSARRGLLLPQSGPYPATIIPLGTGGGPHLRANRGDRESGDYASSDVQSIGSRLSTMSIDTSRSEQLEGPVGMSSPSYLSAHGGKGQSFQKLVGYASRSSASEEGLSASQSSDYEDQEDLDSVQQLTVHSAGESGGRSPGVSLVGRMRGLRQDVQKKISRLRTSGPAATPQTSGALAERRGETFPSTSSVESLPSGSGSSTQALVPAAGSNHSSLSAEDRDASPISQTTSSAASQIIGKARALVDYTPNPYEKDFLKFKKGDIIDVIAMNATGVWRGMVHNRVGNFKFVNVELISDKVLQRVSGISSGTSRQRNSKYGTTGGRCGSRGRPRTVEELLQRMSLEEHISVFVLNGYENLELFKDLEEEDLDYLGITNSEHRAKILTAVELLHDYDSPGSPEDTDGEDAVSSSEDEATSQQSECSSVQQQLDAAAKTTFRRLQFPRDSGCYDSKHHHRHHHHHHHHKKSFPQGGTLPHHHHHHHHHKSCRSKDMTESCAGTMRPQGGMDCMARLHHCSSRDISSNKDSGIVTSLLQQCSGAGHPEGGSELGYTMGTGPKLQVGPANEPSDTGKQGHTAAGTGTSQQQQSQQSFHPNIPISSSNSSASPIVHLPSGSDFQGAGGGGRSLMISASTVSSSVSSSSPIRTCATSPFNTDFKSDSYVVARGKLVSVESCRKTGSPSSPIGGMRCTKKQPQQQQVLVDSPRHSPSNPFCTATTNVADMAAATPTSCSGGAVIVEDACETNPKLTMVKYVVGGSSDLGLGCESGNVMGRGGGGCCLSEKSSDSGVSSSSLSSANPREGCSKREGRGGLSGQSVVESPTKGFIGFGNCLNNSHGSSPTGNNSKNLILQGPEKTSYQ